MSAQKSLTVALQKQVLRMEDDLRVRVEQDEPTRLSWQAEHRQAVARRRTAASWSAWRDDRVTQAAVAWVLTTVFVRFCEDNGLVDPVWIAGPPERRQEAMDAELAFYRERSSQGADVTARDWVLQAVDHLAKLKATAQLVDQHAALHLVQPSGDAAGALVAFWRERGDDGALVHDFTDLELDTRFLGDLYQDLSEYAQATFALLQTPEFVEEFILDQTLEPALAERPLEGFKLIDPTCGSGHFLLGAFSRLLDRWQRHAPGMERQALVQQALDAIHGVDLNAFAVAISRFRLMVAALQPSGLRSLEEAPDFRFHLAVGDSLLHGAGQLTLGEDADLAGFTYATEDLASLRVILSSGRYDAVVGNPPYISVKDRELRDAYRRRYADVVAGKYVLAVPFMRRFFDLAKSRAGEGSTGWVGQITANSFMRREFGKPLVESFLANRDLRLIVDTSGAHIPGHSTPTVILIGRNQQKVSAVTRLVVALSGEAPKMLTAQGGPLWRSMIDHVLQVGWSDEWIEVLDVPREKLARHPWTLGSDAAQELKASIDQSARKRVKDLTLRIGFFGITGADEMFLAPPGSFERLGVSASAVRTHLAGEEVRDWATSPREKVFYPYDSRGEIRSVEDLSADRYLWPCRSILGARRTFAGKTYIEAGRPWWGWHQLPLDRDASDVTLTYANVATHTHFAEGDRRFAFNSKAVVLKFQRGVDVDVVAGIAGALNSSLAVFWLRSVALPKPLVGEEWQRRYEFDATKVGSFPLPEELPLDLSKALVEEAREYQRVSNYSFPAEHAPLEEQISAFDEAAGESRGRMIALQEELDWAVYRIYGLIDEDLTYPQNSVPELALGERAFEIALARNTPGHAEGAGWFARHGSTAITEIPSHWPTGYRELVQRRLYLIETHPYIRLLERPEYKRRWAQGSREKQRDTALRSWLLSRLEERSHWFDNQGRPAPRSVAQLADEISRVPEIVSVLALWEGRPDVPVLQSLLKLLVDESVPYLAAFRHKDSGLRKREAWERVWELQRRRDAGENLDETLPPKYAAIDFRSESYWKARGTLDVPKERFILYPDAGREIDPTPLLGWAGWDYAQQSLALSVTIGAREADGWDDSRLVPLVAGLAELQPWVEQWHADVDPAFGVSLAAFCREQLTARASQVGKTFDELAAWRPQPVTRGRKPRGAAS